MFLSDIIDRRNMKNTTKLLNVLLQGARHKPEDILNYPMAIYEITENIQKEEPELYEASMVKSNKTINLFKEQTANIEEAITDLWIFYVKTLAINAREDNMEEFAFTTIALLPALKKLMQERESK